MKKVKFTFWLLGFGCGVILAGIIGTFLSLRINLKTVGVEEKQIISALPSEEVAPKSEQEMCEVYIPYTSGASEICIILEKAGVVEDGESFLEYIKLHQKQTKLKNGEFLLPSKAEYETLLELLLP